MILKTRVILTVAIGGCTALAAMAGESLFVLSGTYGMSRPANLYRIDPGSSDLLLQAGHLSDGVDRVFVDREQKKIVVAYPPIAPTTFSVLDMKAASVVAKASIPYDLHALMPGNLVYLLNVPGRGLMIALGLGQGWKEPFVKVETLTAVPLSEGATPVTLPLADVQFMHLSGLPGGGLEPYPAEVTGDPLRILLSDPRGSITNMPAPRPVNTAHPDSYFMPVNDERRAVLIPAFTKGDLRAFDLLDKTKGVWQHIDVPVPFNLRIHSFGDWIAIVSESSEFRVDSSSRLLPPTRISPGRENRQAVEVDSKVSIEDVYYSAHAYFPGTLWIYNTVDGKSFQITTGEGDSEVLLIENGKVYYRVNDSIFSAPVSNSGLGEPTLIAKDIRLFQAHWAFLSDKANPPAPPEAPPAQDTRFSRTLRVPAPAQ